MTKDLDKIKTTIVSYEEFSDYMFIPPATYYIMDSMQNYFFIHTSDRQAAQQVVNEKYGENRYTVVAAKITKGRIKNEAGIYTCTGVSTRRGQKK